MQINFMFNRKKKNKPLNQHSLMEIENWLNQMGASNSSTNPCHWELKNKNWFAEIILTEEELKVVWKDESNSCIKRSFSYDFLINDIEQAIMDGP